MKNSDLDGRMGKMNSDTLVLITDRLNKTKSRWGIGGSMLLNQYGLIDIVNDLDIIVDTSDIEVVLNELRLLGTERNVEPLDPYQTTF
ncbi:hypothetical protein ACERII_24645 [Evansella sp. AB-rgal1]|uniref:hypothetical protein n=1 Tax=Evansella sp. AB-rgal1 TaxID=3242696 RepID=UPI00359CEE6E